LIYLSNANIDYPTAYGGHRHFVTEITAVYATWRFRRFKRPLRKLFDVIKQFSSCYINGEKKMPKREMTTMTEVLKKDFAQDFLSKIQMLPIEKILSNEDNLYKMPNKQIEILMEIFEKQGGMLENLVVKDNNDGTYTVISGHKHFEAVRWLVKDKGFPSDLPCLVKHYKNKKEELLDFLSLNRTKRVLSDSELVKSYDWAKKHFQSKKLRGEMSGKMREAIAEVLGKSTTQIGKIEYIKKNAIDEVKSALLEDKVSISTAQKIARLPEEEQHKLIKEKPIEEIKAGEVDQLLKDITKDKKEKAVEFYNSMLENQCLYYSKNKSLAKSEEKWYNIKG
jgi:ParB family chromosome partitioning protein